MPDIPSWPRAHYTSGRGDAYVLFLAYGDFREMPSIDGKKYRCAGVPKGLELSRYDRARHGDWLAGWEQGYVREKLQRDNRELANTIAHSPACLAIGGAVADPPTLDYLRDAVGLMTFALDHGGVAIYDPQMFHFFTPAEWRERIFEPAGAVPRHHVIILASREEANPDLTWFHTRGLRKFGRPDISVHNVGNRHHDGVIDLCNRFIEFEAFGGVIDEGQEMQIKSLPPGGIARHAGSLEDDEFNNVHVEIAWPSGGLQ